MQPFTLPEGPYTNPHR